MDRKLRKILTDCIRDVETGARDVDACLKRHPDRAAELRPHLELWSGLNAAPKAQPNFGSQQRGQQQLLGALADMERERGRRMIPFLTPAVAKVAVVVAAAALLAGGAAGASAALGGPDVAGEVLSTVGVTSSHDGAPPAAEDGRNTAERGAENSDGAPPAADDGRDTADRGAENSDGAPPAAEDGRSTADEGADGAGDASQDHIPDDVPPESPPASDSVSDDASVPDSVPVGPTP